MYKDGSSATKPELSRQVSLKEIGVKSGQDIVEKTRPEQRSAQQTGPSPPGDGSLGRCDLALVQAQQRSGDLKQL